MASYRAKQELDNIPFIADGSFINVDVNEFLVSQLKLSTTDQTIGKIVYFWVIQLIEILI